MLNVMRRVVAGMLLALAANAGAQAAASDYVFEPVQVDVRRAGNDAVVAVRLIHKPTGRPVSGAVIIQTRLDMAPDNMGEMLAPLAPLPSPEPGVYAFKTSLSMNGRWQLSIAAKVQGEPETVVSRVVFRAAR